MSETIYTLYPVFVGSDDLRDVLDDTDDRRDAAQEIGRASCRERV